MPLSAGMTKINLSLMTAVVLAAPLASAEPFVQITPGVGVAATAAKLPDGSNVSLSGVGGTFDLEVGRSFGNFILAGDLSATSVVGPNFKKDDMDIKIDKNIGWSTAFFGATAAYYVMPLDLRIAGGFGAFRMALDVPDMDLKRSNVGGAAKLAIGKEWWVSDKWGLGVNLESIAGAVPDDGTDKGWGFFAADIAMSATYR